MLSGIPVVLAASPPHRINADAMLLEATSILISCGHTNIAFQAPDYLHTGYVRYGRSNAQYCSMLQQLVNMPNEAAMG